MPRARIAVAALSVCLGFAGAALVLATAGEHAGGGGAGGGAGAVVHTFVMPVREPPVALVPARTRCRVDAAARTIAFRIVLRNDGQLSHNARVHPWVGFGDGGEIAETTHDQQVSVPATGTREIEIVLPYEPRIHAPDRCRVYVDAERYAAVALVRAP
jgi:hypothetical protein